MTDKKSFNCQTPGNAVYGLGLIGSLFYFYPQMTSFGAVIMSLGKSIVWPAILVYHSLKLLGI